MISISRPLKSRRRFQIPERKARMVSISGRFNNLMRN